MDLFRIGSQLGFKPNEVLDMSLDMLKACVQGYADRIFDEQLLGVQAGYWAGYYQRAKRPTPPKTIIAKMLSKRDTAEARENRKHADDVDVEGFLAMEARFQEKFSGLYATDE